MKRVLVFVALVALFVSCTESREKKAETLVKKEIVKKLYKPETYKPVETKVDSAFAPYDDPVLMGKMDEMQDLAKAIEELDRESRSARSSMAIWESYMYELGKYRYDEAKEKYDKANAELEKNKRVLLEKYQEVAGLLWQEPKFVGFKVSHNYRADNNAGNTLIGDKIFIVDEHFKDILYSCEQDYYEGMQNSMRLMVEKIEEELNN